MPLPERHHFARSSFRILLAVSVGLLCGMAAGCETITKTSRGPQLTAFETDAQLRRVLRRWVAEPPPPAPPRSFLSPKSSPPSYAVGTKYKPGDEIPETVLITGSLIRGTAAVGVPVTNLSPTDSITNAQEANVDEGDIVKLRGNTLVILRRGRLFTVSIAGGRMRPIDSINAYPPGVDARNDWYDEMLLAGDRVVVIGYSYARGGTEIISKRVFALLGYELVEGTLSDSSIEEIGRVSFAPAGGARTDARP